MNRHLHNTMIAQYATPEVSGNGLVNWEDGKKCVIPNVKLYGAAVQDGTPTPDNPIMPVCNSEVFVSRGQNLVNPDEIFQVGYSFGVSYIQTWKIPSLPMTGSTESTGIGTIIPCKKDQIYTCSYVGDYDGSAGIAEYKSLEDVTRYTLAVKHSTAGIKKTVSITASDDGFLVCLVAGMWVNGNTNLLAYDKSNIVVTCGSAPAPYTPYYDGGQARAPELWAIPGTEYRDEWNPQTGRGIRRCAVIDSYAGEVVGTPYISSTGALTEGAMIVYGIPDTPFYSPPARLTMPTGYGQIIQTGGDVADCHIAVKYLTHQGGIK